MEPGEISREGTLVSISDPEGPDELVDVLIEMPEVWTPAGYVHRFEVRTPKGSLPDGLDRGDRVRAVEHIGATSGLTFLRLERAEP